MARAEAQDSSLVTIFQQAMIKLGWHENRDVEFAYRWAGGDVGRMQTLAKELIGLRPDVIVAQSTQNVLAVLRETRAIPIVFREVVDPVVTGLVPSLSRPGANVTGFTHFEPSINGKYVEFLKEIAPHITCVAILLNPATGTPNGEIFHRAYEQPAATLGLKFIESRVYNIAELEGSIAALMQEPNCGVVVPFQSFFTANFSRVLELVTRSRLPAIYGTRIYVERGGLASYGVDQLEVTRQVAEYVDHILRGEKPGDMPVQAPTKFELIINAKTAKALGLTLPPTLLARVDEVIE
jgi:putative ABC transport system substrate-binding protein